MGLSKFYDALGISRYSTLNDIYNAYMGRMSQFEPRAKRGASFVMYPEELRNEIWYYNVAYLSVCANRDMLSGKSERKTYIKLLKGHRKVERVGIGEQFLVLILTCVLWEILILLWQGLRWLWAYIVNMWT